MYKRQEYLSNKLIKLSHIKNSRYNKTHDHSYTQTKVKHHYTKTIKASERRTLKQDTSNNTKDIIHYYGDNKTVVKVILLSEFPTNI